MKFIHGQVNHRKFVGSLEDGKIKVFSFNEQTAERGVMAVIEMLTGGVELPPFEDQLLNYADVQVLAPIPYPRRNIFCVVKNYMSLIREVASKGISAEIPKEPVTYTKIPDCVIGHNAAIKSHVEITKSVDYEAELGVIIGKAGRNIAENDAMDYVFGYTIINDVAARDIQVDHNQWDLSKSLDTFCPLGPVITTKDGVDENNLAIRCWVNDQLRQDGNTNDFIFDIPKIIATISKGITLYPGDIIATGSPSGVGLGMNPPIYLKHGDKVTISIDHIGELTNIVSD